MMEPFPVRSRFVTLLSVASVIACVLLIAQDISAISMIRSIEEQPMVRTMQGIMPEAVISPVDSYVDIVIQFFGIAASIALWNRLEWGRKLYITVLASATVWNIIASFRSALALSDLAPVTGTAGTMVIAMLSAAASAGLSGWIIWKLMQQEVREEFARPEPPSLLGGGGSGRRGRRV